MSHVGADGSTMAQRISAAGFTTFPQAENVAGRQTSALQVAADWMCSQDHRLNLMVRRGQAAAGPVCSADVPACSHPRRVAAKLLCLLTESDSSFTLHLQSCDIDSVGTATSYDVDNQAYYVQVRVVVTSSRRCGACGGRSGQNLMQHKCPHVIMHHAWL